MSKPLLPLALAHTPVLAILRRCPPHSVDAVAGAAIEAGLTVIEVTLDSERTFDQIAAIRAAYPQAVVGVGSVRRGVEVAPALLAGASFVVSPVVDEETIAAALDSGIACFPGAATPTEIERAVRLGATAVKVFPAESLGGPEYIRAVMSPLGNPALIPTGGITAANMAGYLAAGAIAVGIGGSLFPKAAIEAGDASEVARLAGEVVGALR
jgi:2-dehydro-3-deoxyphosphogluconate aldolase/(4S)-4-hydroxy-2-oxoglutarate aldolase